VAALKELLLRISRLVEEVPEIGSSMLASAWSQSESWPKS